MPITSRRTGLLGFLLALAALGAASQASASATPSSAPATPASTTPSSASIENRLSRIAAAIRAREGLLPGQARPSADQQLAYGFANRIGPGGFLNGAYGGAFRNAHPYYGGYPRGFVNGGGGFVNARPGGSFVNAPYRGGAFRNW